MDSRSNPRLGRERHTVAVMIGLYCRVRHRGGGKPCPECTALCDYALARIERCRFGEFKPQCGRCTVHCFAPAMRQKIRTVMAAGGPLMLVCHPWLTLMHLVDGVRFNRRCRARQAHGRQGSGPEGPDVSAGREGGA
jgi:hypothetical protein